MPGPIEDGEHRQPQESPDEEAPLLGQDTVKEVSPGFRRNVLTICAALLIILSVGQYLILPPTNQIMEEIICKEYFPESLDGSHSQPSDTCKSPAVQGRLASIRGWHFTLNGIPSLLTAIIYGVASDRYGRKPILLLSLIGLTLGQLWVLFVLYLPAIFVVEWTWANSAFCLIGGGNTVLTNMLYTIGADVVPVSQRSNVFFRLGGLEMVAGAFAQPLGGLMVDYSPWLTFCLGIVCMILGIFVILILPETLQLREAAITEREQADEPEDHTPSAPELEDDEDSINRKRGVIREGLELMVKDLKNSWTFLFGNTHLVLLLFALMTFQLGRFVQEILLQYAAKRYNWSWGRAAFILTVKNVSQAASLFLILPALSWLFVAKLHLMPVTKDLWLSRVAVLGGVAGALGIAFAVTPPLLVIALIIFGIGAGFLFTVRSLLNALVEAHLIGTLNATIGFCDDLGMLVAAPALSGAFKKGLQLGGPWIGLPFILSAGLLFNSTVIIWMYRLRPKEPH